MDLQKKTKIVATIGPSSCDPRIIKELIIKGVDVFRLNFSHGNHQFLDQAIKDIRESGCETEREPGIIADLQGPKIRTGKTANDKSIRLETGFKVKVTSDNVLCTNQIISVDYSHLASEIHPGQIMMINDGAIELRVETINSDMSLECIVIRGGQYSSHKGVNLPDIDLAIPSLTDKDREDLVFIMKKEIQYVALSFVRKAADLQELKQVISTKRKDIKIIAKIEKPEAARKVEEILSVSDGIMVARGDLGVEATPYVVPILQKQLIESASKAGKLVIVATQMLESMIQNPDPTRAEAADIANAIIDNTDAIMLSGETAIGKYPVKAVEMMVEIAKVTENSHYVRKNLIGEIQINTNLPNAICDAAVWACRDMGGIPICLFTLSGTSALYLSKLRSPSPLFVFSPDYQVIRMLALAWNVRPIYLPFANDITSLQQSGEELLIEEGYIRKGDLIALVSGPVGVKGATNSLTIKRAGEEENKVLNQHLSMSFQTIPAE